MYRAVALVSLSSLLAVVSGQQVGTLTTETHPKLTTSKCTSSGCTTVSGSVVLDSNWRWLHETSGSTNCYTGNTWDTTLCPDPVTCTTNCALDGADYSSTYGIETSSDALTLTFVTEGTYSTNIGSRVYLMDSADSEYQMFQLKNQEFTFDVDLSNLPCGLNGALYFVEMDADGGLAKYSTNKAGAKYGTGYCDTQCPHDIKFIDGEANILNWTASATDVNAGTGQYGSCCNEMDIWEANSVSAAYTPHVCTVEGQYRCNGTECGDDSTGNRYNGLCDKDGCDFNSYRMGNTTFYGSGMTVDTSSKFTVVTQFITDDGTSSGTLTEIRRKYVQNGVVIDNSYSKITGIDSVNSITDDFCVQQKAAFGDTDSFESRGGLAEMGNALATGMVLVMSLWDDHAANMLWLDSDYPLTKSASTAGVARGTCSTSSGVPSDVESTYADASVTFSNIKYGDLDSTYGTSSSSGTTSASSSTTSAASSGTVAKYGQCGGTGYSGSTSCVSGSTCTVLNAYYSQCL
ncbi:Exoglucanase 1 [Rhizina undulata]